MQFLILTNRQLQDKLEFTHNIHIYTHTYKMISNLLQKKLNKKSKLHCCCAAYFRKQVIY